MAVIVEFKQRDRALKTTADIGSGFKLLFFTGIRYERMEAEKSRTRPAPKQMRRPAGHAGRRKA